MSEHVDVEKLLNALSGGEKPGEAEFRRLKHTFAELEAQARRERDGPVASPKMAFVQQLARDHLIYLYETKELTFQQIGELYGVSHERARDVFKRLSGEIRDLRGRNGAKRPA